MVEGGEWGVGFGGGGIGGTEGGRMGDEDMEV